MPNKKAQKKQGGKLAVIESQDNPNGESRGRPGLATRKRWTEEEIIFHFWSTERFKDIVVRQQDLLVMLYRGRKALECLEVGLIGCQRMVGELRAVADTLKQDETALGLGRENAVEEKLCGLELPATIEKIIFALESADKAVRSIGSPYRNMVEDQQGRMYTSANL